MFDLFEGVAIMAVINDTRPSAAAAQPNPRVPLHTEEEMDQVKRYVLLGVTLRILDHDIRAVAASGMKLPRLYESMLRGVQDRVLLEMAAIRRQFRRRGIKIYEERRESDGLSAQYICRGYHHRFFMLWTFVKAESERLLRSYLAH